MTPCHDQPFDFTVAQTSEEFIKLEHPQVRYLYETDGKDERPAHIPIAQWDALYNGNQWEPKAIGGRQ